MRHVIAGTAGHIDHGKSALVRALTGIDPDRLKEEKLRGITIDLGFAHLELGGLQVGFVDVPGHEKFVKNMLAGVGGIDFVLLVVAADESIMPQTREHFDICRLLAIQAGAVVITKIDTIERELVEVVREEIVETIQGSFLDGASIIPVSSKTGEGIDELKGVIRMLAETVPERPSGRLLRLPIDRAFTIRGFGTVVTGTLTSGKISKEQEVELIPGGLISRVRGIQVHGQMTGQAVAGQRTAVNLQNVDLAQVQRGMVVTVSQHFHSTQMADVSLSLLPTAARPLKNLIKVRFHLGTAEVLARVALLGVNSLSPGDSTCAQLRLDSRIYCLHGDSFIIRQFSPAITIGGGKILNPHPIKHKTTDVDAYRTLQDLNTGSILMNIPRLLGAQKRAAMKFNELNSRLGLEPEILMQICSSRAESHEIRIVQGQDPILLLPAMVESLEKSTLEQIKIFHNQNPLQRGIPREELRKKIYDDLPQEVFRYCLVNLENQNKISVHEDSVALHGREVQLSEKGLQVRDRIEEVCRGSGYQPATLSELSASVGADSEEVRKIYFWMLKEKILVRISEDLAIHRVTLEEIEKKIRSRYAPGAKFGISEFKELFDLTRKHAIPLLEFLDRERITRRQGNERVLL